jgi:hypothetical protein
MKNDNESTIRNKPIIPLPHEAIEEANQPFGFTVVSKGTVYSVNTHFDLNGRESVLEQLKRLLLAD